MPGRHQCRAGSRLGARWYPKCATGLPVKSILHLIDTPGPGGAETVFADLVLGLPPDRFRSIPVIPGPGWIHDALRARGVEPQVLSPTGNRLGYLAALRRLIRRERVDVVHGHLVGAALYGALAARLAGARAICTFHGPADLPEPDRLRGVRFRMIGAANAQVVFVSAALRRTFLAATPLDAARAQVIHNGVDTGSFARALPAPLRRELGVPDGVLLVGCLGNIREPKGHLVLLKALALLSPDLPPWHVAIVGDTSGAVFPPVQEACHALGLEARVSFVGYREDAAAVLRSLDLFVLPSLSEGFSLATVQALAAGVAVLATRSGGPEEIVTHEESGVLVPPGDAPALAQALTRLLRSPETRARLAAAGPVAIRDRFSLTTMIDAYGRLYDGP